MWNNLSRHLALGLGLMVLVWAVGPAWGQVAPASAPASGPGGAQSQPAALTRLHCIVVNEASMAPADIEIVAHMMGATNWTPLGGLRTDKTGACDVVFPGTGPALLMLRITAPGYRETEAVYVPDPEDVIPWLTVTLKGARQLSGVVLDQDEKPVANATVALEMADNKPRSGVTDGEGQFLLKDLMPMRATVKVAVPGVGMASYQVDLATQEEPLKIVLQPQRQVTLRILDSDSKPVADLAVKITAPQESDLRTDSDGRVVIPGIGANAAIVKVSLDDKFYCLDEPVMKLNVDEGEEPVELEMFASHGGRIVGQVVEMIDDEAEGLPAASIWLVEGGTIGRHIETDEDGKFEFNAVPAESQVVAAGQPAYATAIQRVEVEAGKEYQLRYVLDYGTTVKGVVVDVSGKPVERAIIRVMAWYPKKPADRGSASRPAEGGEAEPIQLPWRNTRAGAKGEYMIEHLPAGRIVIEAATAEGGSRTVVNVQVTAGKDVMERRIVLTGSEEPPPM